MNARTNTDAMLDTATALPIATSSDAQLQALWSQHAEGLRTCFATGANETDCDAGYVKSFAALDEIKRAQPASLTGLLIKLRAEFDYINESEAASLAALEPRARALTAEECWPEEALDLWNTIREIERIAYPLPTAARLQFDSLVAQHRQLAAQDDQYHDTVLAPLQDARLAGEASDNDAWEKVAAESERRTKAAYNALTSVLDMPAPDLGALADQMALFHDHFGYDEHFGDPDFAAEHLRKFVDSARRLRSTAPTPADPDAEIIDLFGRWKEAMRAYDSKPRRHDDPEDVAASKAYSDLEDQILATPAYGAAGIGAKALIAGLIDYGSAAPSSDPVELCLAEDERPTTPARALLSIIADLARIAPAVAIPVTLAS